jgi:site-specific DNA recombinase
MRRRRKWFRPEVTIRRDEIEARVLHALQEKLLRRDLFEEFCHEFTREVSRLRTAASASVTATQRELGRVQAEIGKLVQALKDGVPASIVKDPLIALEAQQTELRARKDGQLSRLRCCIPTWRTFTERK